MEQDLSAESEQEGRERDRLVQVVGRRALAFGRARDGHVARRLGWRILPRLAALREPATIRHPEGSSFVLLLVHEILRREGGGPLPARAEELSWHQRGIQYAMARNRRIRSSIGGGVLERLASRRPPVGMAGEGGGVGGAPARREAHPA